MYPVTLLNRLPGGIGSRIARLCARPLALTTALAILLTASSHLTLTAAHTTALAAAWTAGESRTCQRYGNQKNRDFAHCFHDEVLDKNYEGLPSAPHAASPTPPSSGTHAPLAGFEASAIRMTRSWIRTRCRLLAEIPGRHIFGLGANEGGGRRQDVLRQGKIQRPGQHFASGSREGLPPGGCGQQQQRNEEGE
jgi:hypothetical protein